MKTLLSKSSRSLVYLYHRDDQTKEIWKISKEDHTGLNPLQKEFSITQQLISPNFRKAVKFTNYHNQQALVLPYLEGSSLKKICSKKSFTLDDFFFVALKILDALEELEQHQIIHNRINPENILIDENQAIYLIDFSKAEHRPFYFNYTHAPGDIDELAYFSPEMTGKLRKKISYSSDHYSFGVVCFELLTNKLPFSSNGQQELLHEIVTQPCPLIRWLNPTVPKFLEEIITKLLAKSPEDRYRSIHGIRHDLEVCKKYKNEPEKLLTFTVGQEDWSSQLFISQKLYGRTAELNIISNSIETTVKGHKQFLGIYGEQGSGKSEFGKSIHLEAIKQHCLFISGRFEPNKGIPFQAFQQALTQLVSILLMENQDVLDDWKTAIMKATGNIGKVLTDLVPDFKMIIGEQPAAPQLDGAEAFHRVTYLFQRLFECIANRAQPFIIFLDDLHYADQSSLDLIQAILSYPSIHHFMLIFTDRSGEEKHSSTALWNELSAETIIKKKIWLDNLNESAVEQLLVDSFKMKDTEALSKLVFNKTLGNPFFIHQFIQALSANGILFFSPGKKLWEYDTQKIKSIPATENVIEYLCANLKKISSECQHYLRIASCLGYHFKPDDLSFLASVPVNTCCHILEEALLTGVLEMGQDNLNPQYRFVHQRFFDFFLEQIPTWLKTELHYRIGSFKKSQKNLNTISLNELYEITSHLNLGKQHMLADDRILLIQINFLVGKKNKESNAFSLAYESFETAIDLVHTDDWITHYSLLLDLFSEAAESAAIVGKRSIAEQWAEETIRNGKTILDKIKGYETQLHILNENHEMAESVILLLNILKQLGLPIKQKTSIISLTLNFLKTKRLFWFRKIEDILNFPLMKEERVNLFMKLTSKCTTSIFSAAPELLPIVIFKQVQLSAKYGNSPYSPIAYASYGFALSSIMGDLNQGYRFGELALELCEKIQSKEAKPKVMNIFYGFLSHWKVDIKEAIQPLKQAYVIGRENGDLLYASFALTFHSSFLFFSGENLLIILKKMEEDSLIIKTMNQDLVYVVSEIQRQFIQSLVALPEDVQIKGDEDTEDKLISKLVSKKDSADLFDFYVYKLIQSVLDGDHELANTYLERAFVYKDQTTSRQPTYPHFLLFSALNAAKLYRINQKVSLLRYIKDVVKKVKAMYQIAPVNFEANYFLVMAFLNYTAHETDAALKFSLKAAQSADTNGYLLQEALAYEFIGEIHAGSEEWSLAKMYLKKSLESFSLWGAHVKCEKLKRKYPELLEKNQLLASSSSLIHFNAEEIIKTGARLSSELTLNSFIINLSNEIVTRLGAERIMIILSENDSLYLRASGKPSDLVFQSILLEKVEKEKIPTSLIYFIKRSKEFFVSDCIRDDLKFAKDLYFQKHKTQSVLCLPILKGSKLLGLIYLENSNIAGVFDPSKIEFLRILSFQLKVSLENILLFEQQKRVQELENDYNKNMLIVNSAAEENEKKRIANELHDNLGSLLSAIKLYCSFLHENTPSDLSAKINGLLDKAIDCLRQVSHQLSPDMIEKFGLMTSMLSFCEELNDSGKIKIECQIDFEEHLSVTQEINLYRIFQELINNTLKYAKAKKIKVTIKKVNDFLYFGYADDGIGCDLTSLASKKTQSLGIQNIKNRAKILNGELSIQSGIGNGFNATLLIKLKPK